MGAPEQLLVGTLKLSRDPTLYHYIRQGQAHKVCNEDVERLVERESVLLTQVDSISDRKDFDNVRNAMKVLNYTAQEIDTIWKLVASIIHLVSTPLLSPRITAPL